MRSEKIIFANLLCLLFACAVSKHQARPVPKEHVVQFLAERGLSSKSVYFTTEDSFSVSLPRLRLVDGQGNVYFFAEGYSPDTVKQLEAAADRRRIVGKLPPLRLLDFRGKEVSLEDLPRAEFYILEDWATWCAPCPQLMRQIEQFLARQPRGRYTLVKICHDGPSEGPAPRPGRLN